MKLNIGCGRKKKLDYVNIDKRRSVDPDFVINVEHEDLPFEDNTVTEVLMSHVFEHFQHPHVVMQEIYRVCETGAVVTIVCPYYKHHSAYGDPDHKRYMCESSMIYFTKSAVGSDGTPMKEYCGEMDFLINSIQFIDEDNNFIDPENKEDRDKAATIVYHLVVMK